MKDLLKFLVEDIALTRKDKISSIKNSLDDLSDEDINRIYDMINPVDMKSIEDFFKARGLYHIMDNILSYFEKNGDLNMFINYISDHDNMLDMKDFVGDNAMVDGNIFDICCNINNTYKFSKNTLSRLQKETTSGGIKIGEFEYIFRIFLNDIIMDPRDNRGDIISNEYALEMKCGAARISGAGTKPAHVIRQTANKLLKEYGLPEVDVTEFNGKKGITSTKVFFENIYNTTTDIDFTCKLLLESYLSQYSDTNISEGKQIISDLIHDKLFVGNKFNGSAVISLIATISLFAYAKTEGFTHFMIINKLNSNYHCVDARRIDFIPNIYSLFESKKISILSIQNETDNVYGKGIQISYGR